MDNVKTFTLAWYTDINNANETVFERIIAEVDNTSVMFKKEDGQVIFSKNEDGEVDTDYYVMNSESLNEMSIDDFDLEELQNFYKHLCKKSQLCLTA